MQGNQDRLCGLIMKSNCCCDSHSTTIRVRKAQYLLQHKHKHVVRLMLLLWDIAGLRGWRLEVEGRGDDTIDMESVQIRCPHKNARAGFLDFYTLRPELKTCFTGSMWTIGQNDAKHVRLHKRAFHILQNTLKKKGQGHLQHLHWHIMHPHNEEVGIVSHWLTLWLKAEWHSTQTERHGSPTARPTV